MRLPRRRLVVIGNPGAGKSGSLLLLTLGLLARRTPADPVPVLFWLASWDPARAGFTHWLARHLTDKYPIVRPGDARALVRAGRVLPLPGRPRRAARRRRGRGRCRDQRKRA